MARRDGGFCEKELAAPAPEKHRGKHASFVDYRLSWMLRNLKNDGILENPRWSVWRLAEVAAEGPELAAVKAVSAVRLKELQAMSHREYLRTPEWQRTRRAALARASYRCALDRSHTEDLEVHHNTYERKGAELASDLVVLCRSCHHLHHRVNGRPRRPKTEAAASVARVTGSIPPPPAEPSPDTIDSEPSSRRTLLRRLLAGP